MSQDLSGQIVSLTCHECGTANLIVLPPPGVELTLLCDGCYAEFDLRFTEAPTDIATDVEWRADDARGRAA
jgi:hypothetical protein